MLSADIDAAQNWKHSDKFLCRVFNGGTLYFFPAFLIHLKWIEIDIKSRKKREKNDLHLRTSSRVMKAYTLHIAHLRTCSPRKCGSIPPFYCCWFTWSCLSSSIFRLLLLLASKLIMALNFNCVKEEHLQPFPWKTLFGIELLTLTILKCHGFCCPIWYNFRLETNRSGKRAVYVKNLGKYLSIYFYVLFTKSV